MVRCDVTQSCVRTGSSQHSGLSDAGIDSLPRSLTDSNDSLQAKNTDHFKDKESGSDLEVQEKLPLLEWLANNYKKFGCTLEFVTNK